MIAREDEFTTKQEDGTNSTKRPSISSKAWLGLKDSRIMRVSRSSGCKDRHSKVFTVRGLRDRRVRLSVQTAIQLYDLQDRLKLNQPSKAVDWLLNVAQREIDSLPPLQIPTENSLWYQSMAESSHEVPPTQSSSVSHPKVNIDNVGSTNFHSLALSNSIDQSHDESSHARDNQERLPRPSCWRPNDTLRAKNKEVRREKVTTRSDWPKRNEQENQGVFQVQSSQELTFNSPHCPIEVPSNPITGHGYQSQVGERYNNGTVSTQPSSLPLPSQILLYPSETVVPSAWSSYLGSSVDYDPKHINYFQMLSPTSQNPFQVNISNSTVTTSLYSLNPTVRPLQVNIAPKHQLSQNNNEHH